MSESAKGAAAQADFLSGLAHHRQRRLPAAEHFYRLALERFPEHFDALHHLGLILLDTSRPAEAEQALRRALSLQPNSAAAHNSLGAILRALGRYEEAIAEFREAVRLRPDDPRSLDNLCGLLAAQNRIAEAISHLEAATARDPRNPQLHHRLGGMLFAVARSRQAQEAFEAALALNPRSGQYYRCLSDVKIYAPGDPQLVRMEKLAEDEATLPPDERAALHFALGKALADVGRQEDAFTHLLKANRIVRAGIAYDEQAMLSAHEHLKSVFSVAMIRDKAGVGDPSRVPVFIVGMPRSGTSLVEQILASHPLIVAAGESRALERAFSEQFPPHRFPDIVPALGAEALKRLGSDYLRLLREAGDGARITNKMPANFMMVGLIRLALPHARIIHVVRDAVDTCLSCFAQQFGGGDPYLYDLGELGRYYHSYRSLMDHWHAVLPGGVMLDISYEALVGDLEGEGRRMLLHCGLDWDANCLAFHKTERAIWTASAGQVRQPLFRSSIGRWRAKAALLKPLLDGLGTYAPCGRDNY